MEYVKGKPITQYCDEQKLSLEERLELFGQVCSGVQHAHQKGVIHRDLKPSNLLISDQDGKPTAKIIDFGVARATDHRLVEATIFTEQGQIIGTPEYMSPEQAGLDALDIDTIQNIINANSARHVQEIILENNVKGFFDMVSENVYNQMRKHSDEKVPLEIILFNFDGTILGKFK